MLLIWVKSSRISINTSDSAYPDYTYHGSGDEWIFEKIENSKNWTVCFRTLVTQSLNYQKQEIDFVYNHNAIYDFRMLLNSKFGTTELAKNIFRVIDPVTIEKDAGTGDIELDCNGKTIYLFDAKFGDDSCWTQGT